ncbi:MAG TPA: hypothetical protein VGQ33_19680, partial [Vicinamibacteria bacterium]|nr:hypothetical protein [Vicinamibacteria bacterium]
GPTVAEWIARFGGTYAEPHARDDVRPLLDRALAAARAESLRERQTRAREAREFFARDRLLTPLRDWLRSGG